MLSFGIRKETKSIWERRTPIVPDDALELIKKYDLKVFVEPSDIRIFKDDEYRKIGGIVSKRLDTDFIFGIKEIPPDFFEYGKTYIFFSHTIKGQKYNMPMLKRMLEVKTTLIDYEKIVDEKGKRLIAFGRFAGIAGMIDTLWAYAQRLNIEGINTPLSSVKRAYEYHNLQEIKEELGKIKNNIKNGLPKYITPLVISVLGYGNVSSGVKEVLEFLSAKEIEVKDIINFKGENNEIYYAIFKEENLVQRKDMGRFELQDYYKNPEEYISIFDRYIPFSSIIVNAIYWDSRYPRFITKEFFKELYKKGTPKIKVIGDISCDIRGAVEFTEYAEEPDKPSYVYEPLKDSFRFGLEGDGPVVVAIDILPSELPRDASIYFSNVLKKFLPDIIKSDYTDDFKNFNLPEFLRKAVIMYKGNLTENYKYLEKYL